MRISFLLSLLFISLTATAQTSHHVATDYGNLYYQTFGGGPDTLLIINGGPGVDSEGFAELAGNLGQYAFSIIYDQRGTGKSTAKHINAETITMDLMVEDIETLRKELGIKDWVVFGQSFGGMLGSYYTSKHPERVEGMILSASGGIDLENFSQVNVLGKLTTKQRREYDYWTGQIDNGDTSFHALHEMAKSLATAYLYHDKKEHVEAIGLRLTQANMEVNGLVHNNMRSMPFDCKPALRNFQKPVLILQGTEDILPLEIARNTHAILPNSKLVWLEECAHYGWLEKRETYFSEISMFLDQVG
ncbi:alpha/beta fold hydrolase [Roseivirga sp.]|uniref:alpha/beta fold hydrolase n=1 Tax=Roseivirga sp. TaxID=1964215 RepID=UPI003B527830